MATNDIGSWNLDFAAAGRLINIHPGTIARWALRGVRQGDQHLHLDARRYGGKWRTNEAALEKFIQQLSPHFTADTPATGSLSEVL